MRATILTTLGLISITAFTTARAHEPVPIEQRFTPAQLHEAGVDTLTPAQLAALNRLLGADDGMPTSAAATAGAVAGPTPALADPAALLQGAMDGPVRSQAVGRIDGWAPGTVFTLANGQQWRVLKGEVRLRTPLDAPAVEVAPGLAGRWFLQVDEDQPRARVQRVR